MNGLLRRAAELRCQAPRQRLLSSSRVLVLFRTRAYHVFLLVPATDQNDGFGLLQQHSTGPLSEGTPHDTYARGERLLAAFAEVWSYGALARARSKTT